MVAITATLQNVTREGDNVSFMINYSNGEQRNYRSPIEGFTLSQITSQVKSDLEAFESLEAKFNPLKTYMGKQYQLVNGKLVEVKG
jgi:hypothetical protein